MRCGSYKDRPSQADNLHLDVFYKGQNILSDAGSYKYNTDNVTLRYFMGTASHNTVMLGNYDQMKKGGRFIWYFWSRRKNVNINETEDTYNFSGSVYVFAHVSKNILHKREVVKVKGKPQWTIKDTLVNKPSGILMKQLWHLPLEHYPVKWESKDVNDNAIDMQVTRGFVSELYGRKEPNEMVIFRSNKKTIFTEFEIADA
jgi:hypothetical protein